MRAEDISQRQQELLARARQYPPSVLGRIFIELINDADIKTGKELLHTDWISLFETQGQFLERTMPRERFEEIKRFLTSRAYDRRIAELEPSTLAMTFVLGAGASKPSPSDIPTVKELLPQLLERARRLDREDVTQLADFCEERKLDNIEDLLTAAQVATFCSRSPTVLRLMNYLLYRRDSVPGEAAPYWIDPYPYEIRPQQALFRAEQMGAADVSSVAFLQDTLQVLFGLLASTMLPAKPNRAHEAIAEHTKNDQSRIAIVTTNYDCCIDQALVAAGVPFDYRISFSNRDQAGDAAQVETPLIKLHGSLNWYYCETCQQVQLVDMLGMLEQYAEDRAPYPVIGICKTCGGQRRGLLVPPLAMKFDIAPSLTPLIEHAKRAFDSADLIVVVGFSFAEADIYISRMISKSMQTRVGQKLLVVDPSADVSVRVRRKFKASIPGFDESRILRLTGDCAELLPQFLKGELKALAQSRRSGEVKREPDAILRRASGEPQHRSRAAKVRAAD